MWSLLQQGALQRVAFAATSETHCHTTTPTRAPAHQLAHVRPRDRKGGQCHAERGVHDAACPVGREHHSRHIRGRAFLQLNRKGQLTERQPHEAEQQDGLQGLGLLATKRRCHQVACEEREAEEGEQQGLGAWV